MATLEEVEQAIRNADRAGRRDDVMRLAAERERLLNPSIAKDVARSAWSGIRSGAEALAGFPAEVNQMTQRGMGAIARKLFGEQVQRDIADVVPSGLKSQGISTEDVRSGTSALIGPDAYEPKTAAGRYSRAVGEQLPGAIFGPGRWMLKGGQALLSGALGEGAAELAEGTGYEDAARLGGNIAGSFAGGARAGLRELPEDVAQREAVEAIGREGVPLTAGQRSGSQFTKYLESELGGPAFDAMIDRQRSVFTEAAMRRLGAQGGKALPENLRAARNRIGGEFDRLSNATAVPFDQQLQNDLLASAIDYQEVAPQVAPVVENLMNRMGQMAASNGGVLAGPNYKELSTRLRELSAGADVPTGQALDAFRDALDSAVERTLTGPALDEWRNARRQYANLMTVERAMTGGGVEAASGNVSPVRLRSAISGGGQGPAAIAEGRSTMTDLANAGVSVLGDMPPNSGTASRMNARAVAGAGGALGTALATGGDPWASGATAALGGVLGPYLTGPLVMSAPVQTMLSMAPARNPERALLAAILAGRVGYDAGERR